MVPSKSVSGILFPTEQTFASCQLCPREGCPSRQAPYDPALYDKKYRVEKVESASRIAQEGTL
jgi:predicted transcriptional regulator